MMRRGSRRGDAVAIDAGPGALIYSRPGAAPRAAPGGLGMARHSERVLAMVTFQQLDAPPRPRAGRQEDAIR